MNSAFAENGILQAEVKVVVHKLTFMHTLDLTIIPINPIKYSVKWGAFLQYFKNRSKYFFGFVSTCTLTHFRRRVAISSLLGLFRMAPAAESEMTPCDTSSRVKEGNPMTPLLMREKAVGNQFCREVCSAFMALMREIIINTNKDLCLCSFIKIS